MGDSGLGIPAGLLRAADAEAGPVASDVGALPSTPVALAGAPWTGRPGVTVSGVVAAATVGAGMAGWRPTPAVAIVAAVVAVVVAGVRSTGRGRLGPTAQRLARLPSRSGLVAVSSTCGLAALALPSVVARWLAGGAGVRSGLRGLIALNVVVVVALIAVPAAGRVVGRVGDTRSLARLGAGGLAVWGLATAVTSLLRGAPLVGLGLTVSAAALVVAAIAAARAVGSLLAPEQLASGLALTVVWGLALGTLALVVVDAVVGSQGATAMLQWCGALGVGMAGAAWWLGPAALAHDVGEARGPAAEAHGVQPGRPDAALEVAGLYFSYGSQPVLFDVALTVAAGEVAALLGTNGAGKSTLLRAIAGLEHPTGGSVHLFGEDTTYQEAEQIAGAGVALLSGGRMTFPGLTVAENLRVGAEGLPGGVRAARAAVDEALSRFPILAERRSQRAGTLSGGEQQMLALSRVLMRRPRLLLIDELTLGLAPKIVEQLLGVVRAVNADGTTVLLVEQSVNLALALAGHALFLERGEVRFDGATTDLLDRDDLLRPVFLDQPAHRPVRSR